MEVSKVKHLAWAASFAVASMFWAAAWVGKARAEAWVRLAEIEAEQVQEWAWLCEAMAHWRGHQNYRGPDMLNGHCATDPETYAEK
jgi:hypothetical protein